MSLINIDGQSFDIGVIKVTRSARIDVVDLGTTIDGRIHRGAKGTYYDYDVTVSTKHFNVAEYDRLYEVLTNPIAEHTCTLPYGQSSITGTYSITVANDSIVQNFNTFRRWSSLQIKFEALEYAKEGM